MRDGFEVCYSEEAVQDLKNIYQYIAVDLCEPDIAANQVNCIRQKIRALDVFPKRYNVVNWEPWKSLSMHQMPVKNFMVYYLVDEDARSVDIVRIFYGKRDVPELVSLDDQDQEF